MEMRSKTARVPEFNELILLLREPNGFILIHSTVTTFGFPTLFNPLHKRLCDDPYASLLMGRPLDLGGQPSGQPRSGTHRVSGTLGRRSRSGGPNVAVFVCVDQVGIVVQALSPGGRALLSSKRAPVGAKSCRLLLSSG